jgi:hypothetical protein
MPNCFPLPILTLNGAKAVIERLHLHGRLHRGYEGEAIIAVRLPEVANGGRVVIQFAGAQVELEIDDYRVASRGRTRLELKDPISRAKPYCREAFSHPDSDTSVAAALRDRLPIDDEALAGMQFPAVLAHDATLIDALREVCSRRPGWSFRWHAGRIEIGPPTAATAHELNVVEIAETGAGWEVRCTGLLPVLGDKVKAEDREGRVVVWEVEQHDHQHQARITLGEPEPMTASCKWRDLWLDAVVQRPHPLVVSVVWPDGNPVTTQAHLVNLQADRGRCRFGFPVVQGDPVLLRWRTGLFTGSPLAVPLGDSPATAVLEIDAQAVHTKWGEWNDESRKVDFLVADEMHIHN